MSFEEKCKRALKLAIARVPVCESKRYGCTEQLVTEVDQKDKFAYKMLDCHILSNHQYKDLLSCKWSSNKALPSDLQEKINELAEKIVDMGANSCKEDVSDLLVSNEVLGTARDLIRQVLDEKRNVRIDATGLA